MEQKRKDLLIAAALAALFVIFLSQNIFSKKKTAAKPIEASASAPGLVNNLSFLALIKQNEAVLGAQEEIWTQGWRKDPFSLDQGAGAYFGTLVLTGIVWDEKTPIAMVNDEVLRVGDKIQGYTVTKIKSDSIVLSADGQELTIPLFQQPTE